MAALPESRAKDRADEITPEMIDAGVIAWYELVDPDDALDWKLAVIYRAMRAAA